MCMAVDGRGCGARMIDEKERTGDGEWGKLMWVIGMPSDGCPGWEDMAMESCSDGAGAGRERGHLRRHRGQL